MRAGRASRRTGLAVGKRSRGGRVAPIAALVVLGLAAIGMRPAASSASLISYSADPNAIVGSAVEVPALSWSDGVAAATWSDPHCLPVEGTLNTDPGEPLASWSKLLAETVLSSDPQKELQVLLE